MDAATRPSADQRPAWQRRPLVTASFAIHAAAAAGVALAPGGWPWAAGAVFANHLLLSAAGLWPRSSWLGPNLTRLPASAGPTVAVTIDDGPDPEITAAVLEILARERARATFFCIGAELRARPALGRAVVTAGHRIENHSERHLHRFSLLGPRAMRAEIARAQDSIAAVTGRAPRFFRAPAGLRNPFLDPALDALGLRLVSWTRRGFDTVTPQPQAVLARLTRGLAAQDIVLLHDGHAARAPSGRPVILEVLPALLARIRAAGLEPVTLDEALPA